MLAVLVGKKSEVLNMASKRTVPRKRSGKRGSLKTVRKLTRSARTDLARLLQRNQAGTITRVELDTGLKEVKRRLERLMFFQGRI
jgi:hypothetical protein